MGLNNNVQLLSRDFRCVPNLCILAVNIFTGYTSSHNSTAILAQALFHNFRAQSYHQIREIPAFEKNLIGAKWTTWNDRNQHQQRLNRNKPSSLVRCRPWASFEAGPPVNDKKTVTTVILYTQKNIICIKISSHEITLYADFAFVGLQRIKWTKW